MFLGDDKGVPLGERVYVQIGEDEFVLVDLERRNFARGDGTEYAIVFHGADYSTLSDGLIAGGLCGIQWNGRRNGWRVAFGVFLGGKRDGFVTFLERETLEHPGQWYQFYDFFGKCPDEPQKAKFTATAVKKGK